MNNDEILNNLIQELRRGTIVLSVLSQLSNAEYGYNLVQNICDKGLDIDAGTIYPLLRRLEKQGILESKWDTTEVRPRKYYVVSSYGEVVYEKLKDEWRKLSKVMENFLNIDE